MSPTGRVGCNMSSQMLLWMLSCFVPYGACGLQRRCFVSGVLYGCFVPYGACGLQLQAKMHSKKPLIMRLFGHVFAVLCEPITYYSICEQVCQCFWHISAFYQRCGSFVLYPHKKCYPKCKKIRCRVISLTEGR